VVAILFVIILVAGYLFSQNLKRLQAQRARIATLKKELDKLNSQISEQSELITAGAGTQHTPNPSNGAAHHPTHH
jgi:ABC-type nickel/cobalt efflux system permease component RcnA